MNKADRAPIAPLKSPEFILSGPSRCKKPQKGDSPFFSKYRNTFFDVDVDGNTQNKKGENNPMIEKIRAIRRDINANHKDYNPGFQKPVEYYEVTVKNGEISRIVQKRNSEGNKSNKFIAREGFSMKMLGLLDKNSNPKPDGVYIV